MGMALKNMQASAETKEKFRILYEHVDPRFAKTRWDPSVWNMELVEQIDGSVHAVHTTSATLLSGNAALIAAARDATPHQLLHVRAHGDAVVADGCYLRGCYYQDTGGIYAAPTGALVLQFLVNHRWAHVTQSGHATRRVTRKCQACRQ